MRYIRAAFFIILLLSSVSGAGAAQLFLSADTRIKAASYEDLLYSDGTDTVYKSQNLFTEQTSVGLSATGINLENTRDSVMDFKISFKSVGQLSSTSPVSSPQFSDALKYIPSEDKTPFLDEAYVRVNRFVFPLLDVSLGKQYYTLGQGIVLANNNEGFPGAVMTADNLYRGIGAQFLYFHPEVPDGDPYNIYGARLFYKTEEGEWEVYQLRQHGNRYGDSSVLEGKETKDFSGLRYTVSRKKLSFDGEFVMEKGSLEQPDGDETKYDAFAFMMRGEWRMSLLSVENINARLAYGRASGTKDASGDKNGTFYSAFGKRYDGFERSGYGLIAGATLNDFLKTRDTENGLPSNLSGIRIIDAGMDLPYKNIVLSLDYYIFKAASDSDLSEDKNTPLATEMDIKISYNLGRGLTLSGAYASFSPNDETFGDGIKKSTLVYGALSAKF